MGDTFKEIKDKILDIVTFDHDRDEKQLEEIKHDMIPLLENSRTRKSYSTICRADSSIQKNS